jgi:glycosyltransferase involved in cell wall biosynthesis
VQPADAVPRLAIVVPVYGQPVLLADALSSVLSQDQSEPILIAVVVDGCPDPETLEVAESFRTAHPETIRVLHRRNGGLSAARNTGIRYFLAACPQVEAIVFLDSDNLLASGSLGRYRSCLDKRQNVDWFYPEFDFIGLHQSSSNGGDYSLLRHAYSNMCEAGSLVRRRVFDAGTRFDEAMRLGYEDWEFWLSAAGSGFRGAPIEGETLLYRKRPESMLNSSHQNDSAIQEYIRRKHAWLYSPRMALALEHEDSFRYLVVCADTGRYFRCTDPNCRVDARFEEIEAALYSSIVADAAEVPAFVVMTTEAALRWAAELGLLRFAFWNLESRVSGDCVAALGLSGKNDEARYDYIASSTDAVHNSRWDFMMVSTRMLQAIVQDESQDRGRAFASEKSGVSTSYAEIRVPNVSDARPLVAVAASLAMLCEQLRESRYRAALKVNWTWRNTMRYLPKRTELHDFARRSAKGGVLYPLKKSEATIDVGFVTPFFDFGGVERVTAVLAGILRRRGFRTHLFVASRKSVHLTENALRAFDSVNWFPTAKAFASGSERYFGTALHDLDTGEKADLLGLLSPMDVVINEHSGIAHAIAGDLRRRGVVCMTHEHLVEVNPLGRLAGPPYAALAYEAAYDRILTCSNQLAEWMAAMGAPRSKIVALPNGPGYDLAEESANGAREYDFGTRPIHILFLGRLDRQKGVDRIPPILQELARADVPCEFMLVGKSVVDSRSSHLDWPVNVKIRPPVYDDRQLTELYRWADVVLLPSRFEGLPITIPEAQRCGAIVVATDVGAVREAIEHDVSGFVFGEATFVADAARTISALACDPEMARRISMNASAQYLRWEKVCAPLIDDIANLVRSRRERMPVEVPLRRVPR